MQIFEALHLLESHATAAAEPAVSSDVASDQASFQGSLLWHSLLAKYDAEAFESPVGTLSLQLPSSPTLHAPLVPSVPWRVNELPLSTPVLQAAAALQSTLQSMASDASGQEASFLHALSKTAEYLLLSDMAVATAGSSTEHKQGYAVHATRAPHAALVHGLQLQLQTAVRMLGHVAHAWRAEAAAAAAAAAQAVAARQQADALQATLDAIGIDTIVARAAEAEEEADASGRRVARRNTELKQNLRSARRRLALLHREVDELRNMKGQAGRITARFSNLEHLRRREVGVSAALPGGGRGTGALARHPEVPVLALGVNSIHSPPAAHIPDISASRSSSRRSAGSDWLSLRSLPLPRGGGAAAQYTHHIQDDACIDADALSVQHWSTSTEPAASVKRKGVSGGALTGVSSASALQSSLARQTGEADNALTRMQSRLFGEPAASTAPGGDDMLAVAGSVQLTSLWLGVGSSTMGAPAHAPAGASSEQFLLEDSHRVGELAQEGIAGGEGAVLLSALQLAFNDALTDFDGAGSSTYRPLLGKTKRDRSLFVGELTELLAEWRQLVVHEFPKVAQKSPPSEEEPAGATAGAGGAWSAKGILSLDGDSIALTEHLRASAGTPGAEGGGPSPAALHSALLQGVPTRGYLHPAFRLLAWHPEGPAAGRVVFHKSKHRASGHSWTAAGSADASAAWQLFDAQQLQPPAQPRDITLAAAITLLHECMCSKLAQEQAEADTRVRVVEASAKARATTGHAQALPRAESSQSVSSPRHGGLSADDEISHMSAEEPESSFATGEVRAAFRVTLLPFSVFWYEWLSLQYVLQDAVSSVAHSVLSVLCAAPSTPHVALLLGALGGGVQECVWRYFMLQITRLRQLDVQPSATKNLSVIPTALYPPPLTPGLRGWVRDFTATCADPKEPSWTDLYNYLAYVVCSCPQEEPRLHRCAGSLAAVDRSGVGMVPFPLAADTLQRLSGRWHRSAQGAARELLPALFLGAEQLGGGNGEAEGPAPRGWLQHILGERTASPKASLSGQRTVGRPPVDEAGAVLEAEGAEDAGKQGGGGAVHISPTHGTASQPTRSKKHPAAHTSKGPRFPELHIEVLALQCAYCELLAACHDSSIRQASTKGSGAVRSLARGTPIIPSLQSVTA